MSPTGPGGRVDVHRHMVPGPYGRRRRSYGGDAPGGRALPAWNPDVALELLGRHGIATAVPVADHAGRLSGRRSQRGPTDVHGLFPCRKETPRA